MDLEAKLQRKPGVTAAVLGAPEDFTMGGPHAEAEVAEVVIGFAEQRVDLATLGPVMKAARDDRLAWIAYPKAGQLGTDLNRTTLVEAVASEGIQPVRQIAIDEVWSALRFRPA